MKIDAAESHVKVAEALFVKEEAIGDKKMDATAIDDAATHVVEEKEEFVEKEEDLEKKSIFCRKCRKRSFRAKNKESCKKKCPEEILLDEETSTTVAPVMEFLGNIFKLIFPTTTVSQ